MYISHLNALCLFFSEGEIDYVRVLNRALPKDIRIIGWCPVPINFSARFVTHSKILNDDWMRSSWF